ncbi:protein tyrosine phosphatase type IVA 1-like [Branchiostoma lanceolatum]|uniref:PTP4A1 protein n=1 Tax=Branchiostoma lanceolatum TaxID=7740 RepID=A0A8J9Z5Y5_BRALA|nr:PTP4A1 [Branchiostoma lanceolatum]
MARLNRPAPPVVLEHKGMRFLIMDRPSNSNLPKYIEELKSHNVKELVRVCEPTYSTEPLEKEGIHVCDWPFDDGAPPPNNIVDEWFNLLKTRFREDPGSCIAIHCVAGLGRAPVLVALALMESGMKFEDAVQFIRDKRRGAINAKQLNFLEKYRPKSRLKIITRNGGKNNCCVQ